MEMKDRKDYETVAAVDTEEALGTTKDQPPSQEASTPQSNQSTRLPAFIKDGSEGEIRMMLNRLKGLVRPLHVTVRYKSLNLWTMAPEPSIPSVSKAMLGMIGMGDKKRRVDILKDLNGRIAPFKMTLLLGPPGSGRSVFMKALSKRLRTSATLEGEISYNDELESSGKFLVPKLVDYIEQSDHHAATLTVEETLKYAWLSTTGGHHSYAQAVNEDAKDELNFEDDHFTQVRNVVTSLGLTVCKDTFVGDDVIRGVSGGQKKRVTSGEMLVCPRPVKIMDSITNGLDSATAYDIIRTFKDMSHILGMTFLCSLLQPPPEVYDLFDEVMILSEGQIIYHGPRTEILPYFERLGYFCPPHVDPADYLQELPTAEGKYYIREDFKATAPRGTDKLVEAWKQSPLYAALMEEVSHKETIEEDLEKGTTVLTKSGRHTVWHPDLSQYFPKSYSYHFWLTLERQIKMVKRDTIFIQTRIGQAIFTAVLTGSLFSNIRTTDTITMNGLLFYCMLSSAMGSFSMLPIIYHQKQIHYKQNGALYYPTSAFTLSQAMVLLPLQLLETIILAVIIYWSADMASDYNGSRFFTFILLNFTFSVALSQFYRWMGFIMPNMETALPASGILLMLYILFCGFIQPKSLISDGWIWMYWLNPISWGIKSVTLNEFKAPKYDFQTCTNADCSQTQRFGDFVLSQYGNPTDERYIWWCLLVIIGQFFFFLLLSTLSLIYIRWEASPPPPVPLPQDVIAPDMETIKAAELPYDPVSFAFKDIWYTVTLPNKEELDLLRGVSGYFEPGTMTALMGASGAGKTTLMDVLAGRKNTGKIKGEMYINGKPKEENHFRRIMGYVEQFDCLTQKSTPREAIEFSAALRLPASISKEQRDHWTNTVIDMLELSPIADQMIGNTVDGGMSFEQRKRVSIGIELAANPAILFLDEPTTGLDSRAAQVIIRNIRRIAASGRSVVCTIHQPSTPIFNAFDSLLLLRKGGQTVFFGELGQDGKKLIDYFEAQPGVKPISSTQNPATWMLDVIGAGTAIVEQTEDYHALFLSSTLNADNESRLSLLLSQGLDSKGNVLASDEDTGFRTSYPTQFSWILSRAWLTYWRNPSYSLGRMFVSILVALIFASAYPQQDYSDYLGVVSRTAVIYITAMFCAALAMLSVAPVTLADRLVFYRESHAGMYSTALYSFAYNLVELPYIIISALCFVLPFFYIVGFDNVGDITDKFLWYWLFDSLLLGTLVYMGQFFAVLMPTDETVTAISGLSTTVMSLFCGFLIRYQHFPKFWIFMYWLSPLHYALEGLVVTQFHGDTTPITLPNLVVTTAEDYIKSDFESWSYDHVGNNILALCLFIGASWVGRYLCLRYLRHEKR